MIVDDRQARDVAVIELAGEVGLGPSDLQAWADATKEIAAAKDVPLIDLHAKSIELLAELGPSFSASIGPLKNDGTFDRTHLNEEGSALFGSVMIEETRRAAPELARHLREPRRALSRRDVRVLRDGTDPQQRSEGGGAVHLRKPGDGEGVALT